MKKEKKFNFNILKTFFAILLILPCMFVFCACSFGGDSAYDIAVKNGFNGTEKEWLESLKGSDGADGTDGANVTISTHQLYEEAVENHEFEGTYLEFLNKFFSNADDVSSLEAVSNYCTMSVCEVMVVGANRAGSGVVYSLSQDGEAYIITNYHVTYSQTQSGTDKHFISYRLYFYGRTDPVSATFVGGSKRYDISILKVNSSNVLLEMGVKAATFRENPACLGEEVIAIGNALGYGVAISTGVVAMDNEVITNQIGNTLSYRRAIRTTAYIDHGSSGGALFDRNGYLIGITNSGMDKTDDGDKSLNNVNYAIPATIVDVIADRIISESTKIAKIGLKTETTTSTTYYNPTTNRVEVKQKVKITGIQNGSLIYSLYNQGEIKLGDFITMVYVNGTKHEVLNNYQISEIMLSAKVGDVIKFDITRDLGSDELKKSVEVTVTEASLTHFDNDWFMVEVPNSTLVSNAAVVTF